jgi:hypothetical protein
VQLLTHLRDEICKEVLAESGAEPHIPRRDTT